MPAGRVAGGGVLAPCHQLGPEHLATPRGLGRAASKDEKDEGR